MTNENDIYESERYRGKGPADGALICLGCVFCNFHDQDTGKVDCTEYSSVDTADIRLNGCDTYEPDIP